MQRLSFAILVIYVSVAARGAFCEEPPQPKAEWAGNAFHFGAVQQGTVVKHDFVLRNAGTADLRIQKIFSGCGCTSSTPSSDVIAPGEQGSVHVEFDTTGFSGRLERGVRVNTNDPDLPSWSLTLDGVVEPEVLIEPPQVVFGEVSRKVNVSARSKTVMLTVSSGSHAKLGEVKSLSRFLKITNLARDDKSLGLSVELAPETPVGELRDRLVVSLAGSGDARKFLNIPVFASVISGLKLKPVTVSFGVVQGQAELVRTATLESLSDEPLAIEGVECDNKLIRVSYRPLLEGKSYTIEVKVDPKEVDKNISASVKILTDRKDEPRLVLSVHGVMPPKL